MPKELRSSSLDRCRTSPYPNYYKNPNKTPPKSPSPQIGNHHEWEDARCPICIDHPHNAVLLLCSSREKGCRPYMCDTSSRHSNCFDQFRKSTITPNPFQPQPKQLVCPLCRGEISGWIVVDPARDFMNKKPRNCSTETCNFTGTYSELRKHARRDHPCVRPTEVDPDRELEWRILREDMEQQDMYNLQFDYEDTESIDFALQELGELASPMFDLDVDFMNFLSNFEEEFDNMMPTASAMLEDWAVMFGDMDSDSESGGIGNEFNGGENNIVWESLPVPTTRRRSNRNGNGRQRPNWSHQVPDNNHNHHHHHHHNHQVQNLHMNTFFDFHDIGPNFP